MGRKHTHIRESIEYLFDQTMFVAKSVISPVHDIRNTYGGCCVVAGIPVLNHNDSSDRLLRNLVVSMASNLCLFDTLMGRSWDALERGDGF